MLLQPHVGCRFDIQEVMILENLQDLWQYQQADMELDAYKRKVQDTPTRKKILQLKRFLQNSQGKITDAESKAAVKQSALTELNTQAKKLMDEVEEISKDIGYYSECDDAELDQKLVSELVKNSEKVCDAAASVRGEIAKIQNEVLAMDKLIREILQKMRTAKTEYDQLMVEYDKEQAGSSEEQKALEAKLAEAGKKIPQEILAEYKRVKGIRPTPVAILKDNRCDGCKIQLPSGVASSVANSEQLVHCENCGRILIVL